MSVTPKDGGPAYPLHVPLEFQYAQTGMSLLDYFAGQAMAGWFASANAQESIPPGETIEQVRADMCANFYTWADAMLKARGGF